MLLLACLLDAGVAAAEEDGHLGLVEFEIACAPCHGIDGRGDGPLAGSLERPPADLTGIAEASGGTFPSERVRAIIDGRSVVVAHGTRTMPVWGDRYRIEAEPGEDPAAVEERARMQIEALVDYVRSIQAD